MTPRTEPTKEILSKSLHLQIVDYVEQQMAADPDWDKKEGFFLVLWLRREAERLHLV